ncbi:MAG: PAS domain-containing protein [Candidatus Omnitrophota bacterium]
MENKNWIWRFFKRGEHVGKTVREKHKKAEPTLIESEEMWHSLAATAPNYIILVDCNGTIRYINRTKPGITPKEVIGKMTIYDWVKTDYYDEVKEVIKRTFERGEFGSYEAEVSTPDGSTMWCETQAGPLEIEGQIVMATLISTDITERKKIEKDLEKSEERARVMFDNATDGIILADSASKKLYTANKMFCRMLGYTLEEIEKLEVNDIHPEENLPYVIEQFEKQLRGEITLARDIPVKRKDGSVFYADINAAPITFGEKTYLMGVFRDVTERKKTDQDMEEQKELLDKTNKDLRWKIEELEAAMSHIKRLEGMVPICVNCKKLRLEGSDPKDSEAWVTMEKYISERSGASFTHGLCPDCVRKMYGDIRKKE